MSTCDCPGGLLTKWGILEGVPNIGSPLNVSDKVEAVQKRLGEATKAIVIAGDITQS